MGTINYGSNNYINIGLNVNDYDYDDNLALEFEHADITAILEKYSFYYYHITIEWGYYEGFYIDIENNFSICFDDYEEKKEAQKEITEIKAFLRECANYGLVQYFPGWCTGYNDYKGTIKAINEAIKEMRNEVRNTPTWIKYKKEA